MTELDSDCLFMVLQYLPLAEIIRMRRVCKHYCDVSSSNALWFPILKSLNNSTCTNSCYRQFLDIISKLPYIITEEVYKNIIQQELGTSMLNRISFSYLKLENADALDINTFKMAIILSVLNENKHVPRLNDTITIEHLDSYLEDTKFYMPLYELCYYGCEGRLEDFICRHSQLGWNCATRTAIMPYTDTKETIPFVYLERVPDPIKCFSSTAEMFTNQEVYKISASEKTMYNDWAPIYYNASGHWFEVQHFYAWYEPDTKCIVVLKEETEEFEY